MVTNNAAVRLIEVIRALDATAFPRWGVVTYREKDGDAIFCVSGSDRCFRIHENLLGTFNIILLLEYSGNIAKTLDERKDVNLATLVDVIDSLIMDKT